MVLPVKKIMRKNIATCSPTCSVLGVCKILKKFNTSTVVVINKEKHVLGMFSERDLVNKVVTKGLDLKKTKVNEVMTSPVICGDITQTDIEISNLIVSKKIRKVPILKNNELVGLVAEHDLLTYLAESILNDS